MYENRVIPCLLLRENSLVKTVKFNKFKYIGDPMNTCRIFNEMEVDEMVILDIRASIDGKSPQFEYLEKLAGECFMPLAYGGGIRSLEDASRIFKIGFEKVVLNSYIYQNPTLVTEIASTFGSQSLIISIDIRKNLFGKYVPYSKSGSVKQNIDLMQWVSKVVELGAGEILLTNIDREGTWAGYDLELLKRISNSVNVPLVAHGGAGCKKDVEDAVNIGGASAVALGSMVVFQEKDMGVLINYKKNYIFI